MRAFARTSFVVAVAAALAIPAYATGHDDTKYNDTKKTDESKYDDKDKHDEKGVSHDVSKAREKLQKAEAVLRASLEAPDKGIPSDALSKAECVGVFPDVAKGAFIIGGQGGTGVFTCRDENGKMGAPAFFKIGGGSVGWQFGGQQTDLVLLVMNKGGMDHLLEDKFTLGAEATATAGPVGRTLKAATDAQLNAQILAWSRSQGAFLGAALDGSVIKPAEDMNRAMYGEKGETARAILFEHKVPPTSEATAFLRYLNENSERNAG